MKDYNNMYVVAVDMGYGHQRAAYPFAKLAKDGVYVLNDYPTISEWEKNDWNSTRKQYEMISYFKKIPFIGNYIFSVMDYFQSIRPFYPKRDLSSPSFQQKYFYKKIAKGYGRNLVTLLNKNPLPMLTTFFVAAQAAEYYNYKGAIYCVVCDADISRAWAPIDPANSQINYLAPNKRVKERLRLYGVKDDHIFVTGFPLPKENLGDKMSILKADLKQRLEILDPKAIYRKKYEKLIEGYLCPISELDGPRRPFTLSFAVGGAGAQRDLGVTILTKLKDKVLTGKIRLNLIAGSRLDVYEYFSGVLREQFLHNHKNVKLIYAPKKADYFKMFNKALRTTDILWTKPSELSFYAGLGLPIIMTPPIGSQEDYNRRWLLGIGAGVDSKNPEYVDEWLFDFLDSGWLAEAAMRGFLNAPKMGVYNIENLVLHNQAHEIDDVRLL